MELLTIKGTNLNTTVYRGFASIKDIATISAPDTFKQDTNPEGLQRDLSKQHALEGYEYARLAQEYPDSYRLWPEVIINIRDRSVIDEPELVNGQQTLWKIVIHEDRIDKNRESPQISRTDGNHRLFYGEGLPLKGLPPLDIPTPFSLTIGLEAQREASFFVDINDNLKRMNTSHLYHLLARVMGTELLAQEKPTVWLANKLAEDPESPFHGIVYLGGEKEKAQGLDRRVSLAHLRTGIEMMLKESILLRSSKNIENTHKLIRTYWSAVARTFSQEWTDPKKYLLLRGFGIWSMSILGAGILDRCFRRAIDIKLYEDEIVVYLQQTRIDVDWDRSEGNVRHYGGRLGAKELADKMAHSLSDEDATMAKLIKGLESL